MPSRRPAHGTGNSASARKSQGRHNLLLDIAGNAGVVLFDINARFAVRAEHTPREDTLISGGVCYSGVYLTISRAPDLQSSDILRSISDDFKGAGFAFARK